jgi:hypothetical protein
MIDEDPTAEERREAEALARATPDAPVDAQEVAALLGAVKAGELTAADRAAVWRRVQAGPARRPRWAWRVALAVPLAAALAMAVWLGRPGASAPTPSPALLTAQTDAARGHAEGRVALERQMRVFRKGFLASLETRYR